MDANYTHNTLFHVVDAFIHTTSLSYHIIIKMPPTVTNAFKSWLKSNVNIKLASDAAVLRMTCEGVTDYASLNDFDRESIEALSKACSKTIPAVAEDIANGIAAENEVPGANISSISIRRLVVAMYAAKYYTSIGRTLSAANMHYTNVLTGFKTDYEAYILLKKQDEPDPPVVNDKDKEKKIIKWMPLFEDALSRTFGSKGPLIYVLREKAAVPLEADDPLLPDAHFGESGSMIEELILRLPHSGPIFKDDNKTVYMMISKAVAGTSVESTIKSFSRQKDGRGAYQALVANHAGDEKYRAIVKARMNLLQNIKWNGRSYPLEQHISNHRTAVDDLNDCFVHIKNAVPNEAQRVEYLLESITCQDSSLQAAMGNIRADTNNMRSNFESAASHIIEVDPYRRASRQHPKGGRSANVSSITFAGRGKTGVDLRWHTRKEFGSLSNEQKDELSTWQKTKEGKKAIKEQRANAKSYKRTVVDEASNNDKSWKKKFRKAIKTQDGLSHVMTLLAKEEASNAALISGIQSQLPSVPPVMSPSTPIVPSLQTTSVAATNSTPSNAAAISALATAFPALSTKVKLNGILKKKSE